MKAHEQVLVVPEDVVDLVPGLKMYVNSPFEGFAHRDCDIRIFWKSLDAADMMDRAKAEQDTTHKQVIPYILVSCRDKFLAYERSGGNESRLDQKVSIGVGGHVNSEDLGGGSWGRAVYFAVLREVDEELCILERGCRYPASALLCDGMVIKGILYDDSNEVGRVHIGVVLHVEIPEDEASHLQVISEGKNLSWKTADELFELGDRLESWSQKSLKALGAGAVGCMTSLRGLSEEA